MVRIFRVFIPTAVLWLFVSELVLCYGCYILAAAIIQPQPLDLYLIEEGGLIAMTVMVACIVFGNHLHDLYSVIQVRSGSFLVAQILTVLGIALMAQAVFFYVNRSMVMELPQMLLGSALVLLLLPAYRVVFGYLSIRVFGKQKILFLGENELIQEIAAQIEAHPEKGFCSCGYLSESADAELTAKLGPHLGVPGDVEQVARVTRPATVVVGLKERRGRLPIYPLMDLRLSGQHIQDASVLHESLTGRVAVSSLRPSQLVFSDELGPKPRQLLLKEASSLIIAGLGMVIALPVMALVALAVRLTSPGAALYSQVRVGLHGKHFRVYKFRSMYIDAEARTGAVWAIKNDPRITPLGRWLRKLRLDELPQLFNVLKGEMSLVGPRPERPEFVRTLSEQIPFYAQRHFVKPGVTGWAQINHKYGDTVEDTIAKLEYDLYYLKHLSPWLDLYIAFNTVKVMLLSRGSQ